MARSGLMKLIAAAVVLMLTACGGPSSRVCGSVGEGPKKPSETDLCSPAREGDNICPGGRGYGYTCRGGCWQFFWDGPCAR